MLRKQWQDNPFDQFDAEEFVPRWICFGKGGGGGGPQTSTTNTNSLPDYAEPFFTRLLNRTETETNQPYTQYEGARLADFGADTQGSFTNIRDMNTAGNPQNMQNAGELMNNVGYNISAGRQDFQNNGMLDIGANGQTNVQNYMNPYLEEVLNRGQARAKTSFQEDQIGRDASFAQRGAFSNSRRDIASEQARRDLDQQLGDISAKSYAGAFDAAGQMYTSDAQRNLQSQIENERARQSAGQIQMQAGQGLAALGMQEQTMGLQRADAMGRIGGLQEAQNQAQLDIAQQDFTNQRDFERQNLNFYSGILHGVPIEANSEVTRYQAPGNNVGQLLGLGLGGASLYNQIAQGAATGATRGGAKS